MDVSNASNGSTEAGLKLIANLWDEIKIATTCLDRAKTPRGRAIAGRLKCDLAVIELRNMKETMVFAAHRLAFLEMVTKGLTEMDKHDAQAYARFVEKKRNIEDMDIDELRVLLRER